MKKLFYESLENSCEPKKALVFTAEEISNIIAALNERKHRRQRELLICDDDLDIRKILLDEISEISRLQANIIKQLKE